MILFGGMIGSCVVVMVGDGMVVEIFCYCVDFVLLLLVGVDYVCGVMNYDWMEIEVVCVMVSNVVEVVIFVDFSKFGMNSWIGFCELVWIGMLVID